MVHLDSQVLGFPSLFDLPQYLGLFMVGLAAARGDWLMKMPDVMAKRFFRVALIATATLLPLSLLGTVVTSLGWGSLVGYGSLSSAIYAIWDSTFAVGMTMFAISFFRKRFNSPGRLRGFAAKNFYAAYFLQATVIVTFSALILYPIHIRISAQVWIGSDDDTPLDLGAGLSRQKDSSCRPGPVSSRSNDQNLSKIGNIVLVLAGSAKRSLK